MNEARALEFLVQNLVDHQPETMFEGIYQVKPAHYGVADSTGLIEYAYWQLPEQQRSLTMDEAREQLYELLRSAVALRLRSDVPIGSLLSGGLNSTTIVCIVRQLLDRQMATNPFDFFWAVFREEKYSERRYIEKTVRQTGMPIHWIYPDPEELPATLPRLLYHQEFPFRSLAVYSQWEIMRHVRQTPIVVCSTVRVATRSLPVTRPTTLPSSPSTCAACSPAGLCASCGPWSTPARSPRRRGCQLPARVGRGIPAAGTSPASSIPT